MNAFRIAMKDLKFLLRSRTMLFFSILMPILMMLMMGYIFPKTGGSFEGKIGIYSKDPLFTMMILSAKDKIKIYKNKEKLIEALAKNDIIAGAIIPKNFVVTMNKNEEAEMEIIPNPSNPQAAIMMIHFITSIGKKPETLSKKVKAKIINVDGSEFNYYNFMAPGIMAMIAIMSVATGLAASITRERELGTLDGIMVTPISRGSIVVGKIIAQTIRGVVQAFIVLIISLLFFGVKVQGSILTTLLLLILGTFSFIGIGIIITSNFREQETAQVVMTSITFPMMFFSGVFFPIDQMPKVAQYISKIFPLTYAADALRKNITLGVGFKFLWFDVIILILFALFSTTIATIAFPKLVRD